MPKGECPLCLSYGEMNREHVNTKWSRKVISQRIPSATPTQLPPNPWRWVCVSCNDRLEKSFETPSRAVMETLIGAHPKLLIGRDQLLAARWLFKHTLVWGLAHPPETSGLAPELRDPARECLEGLFRDEEPNFAGSIRIGLITAAKVPGPPVDPFSVGPVGTRPWFVEISHQGWLMWESVIMPLEVEPDEVPVFGINLDVRLTQIWPRVHPLLAWPPPRQTLRLEDLLALREAWGVDPARVFESNWLANMDALLKEHGVDPEPPTR